MVVIKSVLREDRYRTLVGALVSVVMVAAATGAIYGLKHVAPVVSLSVVYLPAVLLVSAYWGLALGVLTSLLSAAAFNFFHLPPVGKFTIADSRNWVALAAFIVVAVVVGAMADLVRSRAREAERRRAEANLVAALARELLSGSATETALPIVARLLAEALGLRSAAIELGVRSGDDRRQAVALNDRQGQQLATLLVPRQLPSDAARRLQRHLAPPLAALIAVALQRDALQGEAVETAALRRSDDVKTALLRAVSHDLRTPLTAIVAAGHALGTASLSAEERDELSAAVVGEGERLAALVDKLLDLSKLQAGRAEPRRDWVWLEDVLVAAGGQLAEPRRGQRVEPRNGARLVIEPSLPPIQADAAQLERAFANLLENARRYSNGLPVSVHARQMGDRVVVRVVDQGPGVDPAERERIFEPFYRGPDAAGGRWAGSGLGLAIAKGFIELEGGTIRVESLPGQGTSFVVSLPVQPRRAGD